MEERERALAELDGEMARVLHQRASTMAEEERGRADILQLAVLVANTEQSLSQLAARAEAIVQRGHRLGVEQHDVETQRATAVQRHGQLRLEYGEADRLVGSLHKEQEVLQGETAQATDDLQAVDQLILRRSEELAAVDSRLGALQSVVREEMGYGRHGTDDGTALKSCEGVHDAVAEWLTIPPGMDRAVEAVLGERVHGWFVDTPAVASRVVDFLREQSLGRGSFIPQQPRWSAEASGLWWPAIADQAGVIGRAIDLIQTDAERAAARDCLFDRVVIVESLDHALRLWERNIWSAPNGPVLVTLRGEVLDSSGVLTGGHMQEGQGLLERRREVLELEGRRQSLVTELEDHKGRREELHLQVQSLGQRARVVAESLRRAEMQDLSLRKARMKKVCNRISWIWIPVFAASLRRLSRERSSASGWNRNRDPFKRS
jgi:chromosome segregation protein